MDQKLFTVLLQGMHSISVTSFPEESRLPEAFSEKYCYHPALQSGYTYKNLSETIDKIPVRMIGEVQDVIGLRLLIFRLDGMVWLAGPFVTQTFQEKNVREALIAHRLPVSYIQSLQLFCSAFPLVQDQDIVHTIKVMIRTFCPEEEEYLFRHITSSGDAGKEVVTRENYETRFDYKSIEKRYELENRFLRMIEEGDTDSVLSAFDSMGIAELNTRRYINAVYYLPEISTAMIRALSRKAAERGGASLMEINEITQNFVQTSRGVTSERELIKSLHKMILELTEAVQRHRLSERNYTQPIRKVIGFMRLNYSQNVTLEELANIAGFAPSYLSRQFKAELGLTVSEFIRRLRCRQAARLLKETDISIAEISAYVGYPDNNYFVKTFKKEYGMTPGAFRRNPQNISI